MATQWQQKQLEVGRGLVQQGSQALRQGDFNSAKAALSEAEAILDMAEEESDEVLKVRAQVLNETGFILQRSEKPEQAVENHQRAADICHTLMERGVDFRANAAATNINLAGLLAGQGNFDEAVVANRRAVELAAELLDAGQDPDHARNLSFGANQNYAMILARKGDFEEADKALSKALEVVESLAERHKPAYAQAAQGCQQLSVLYFNEEKFDRALEWGRRAEDLSEKAYEALGEQALPIYVTSQINLISYYEKAGDFADAEDCLFKALEVVGDHPQILARGKAFYEECRKQADRLLDAGNLPRNEVEDGYAELEGRIEAAGGIEEVMAEIEKARQAQQGRQGAKA